MHPNVVENGNKQTNKHLQKNKKKNGTKYRERINHFLLLFKDITIVSFSLSLFLFSARMNQRTRIKL
jgi:hypothetical protein